jgi:hypothetical protein
MLVTGRYGLWGIVRYTLEGYSGGAQEMSVGGESHCDGELVREQ